MQNDAIVIGWLSPDEYDGAANTDGYTQVQWYYQKRGARMFSANVLLMESSTQPWYRPNAGVDGNYANVLKHEVAHALGLWHVSGPGQVMYDTSQPTITDFQVGDLQGLANVSSSLGCF